MRTGADRPAGVVYLSILDVQGGSAAPPSGASAVKRARWQTGQAHPIPPEGPGGGAAAGRCFHMICPPGA